MSIEQFEEISLFLGVGGLIFYMIFIMYKLAEESGAGRFGTLMIFPVSYTHLRAHETT